MSGLAEVLLTTGYQVSGSDLRASDVTERLLRMGGRVFIGHHERNVEGAHIVVYSSAVKADNPELRAAVARGLPVIPRAEMLAELMRMKYGVAIAGAHGKTTTTSMVGAVLLEGGLDPTIVVGGRVHSLGTNARLGQGQFLVAEADESDGSFVRLQPAIGVITNLDKEHMDHYGSVAGLEAAFLEFAERVPFYGLVVVCADDGEKFGGWPGTKEWVSEKGWFERFGQAVQALVTDGTVVLSTFREAMEALPSSGLAYLPTASYREMEGWSLPAAPQAALTALEHELGEERLAGSVG